MDAKAIGPVEKNQIQLDSKLSSLDSKVPSGGTTLGQQTDTVELSQRGQAAVSQQVPKNTGSELRKIDITDDNQVVVKIVDGQTQKVVRQIPREEEVRLKEAMQENLDDLDGGSVSTASVDDIA
jgi:hypothetical protein